MIDNNQYFIKKCFSKYLVPSILSILFGNVSIMIDNCVAGAVMGEQALAGMSLVNPVFNIVTAFGILICGGASTLAGISIGQNNTKKQNVYFSLALYLTIFAGVIVTSLGLLFLDPIIFALGAKGDLFTLAKDYSFVMFCGSTVLMLVYLPLNFFRIKGMGRIAMIMFAVMSVLNIGFDLLFVTVLDWGMKGLSFATILSTLIAIVVIFPVLFSKQAGYHIIKVQKPLKDIKLLIYKGSPLALNNFYLVIRVRVLNSLIMACGGSLALAAYSCANNVNIIGLAIISGIAQTVAPIAGVLYGERDSDGIKDITKKAISFGLIASLSFFVVAALFSSQIAGLFGMVLPQQLSAAREAIVILSANLAFVMLSNVLIYLYSTCNNTNIANALTLLKGIILALPLAFLGAQLAGLSGLLAGLVLAEAITVLIAVITAAYKRKKDKDYMGVLLLSHKIFCNGHCFSQNVLSNSESISQASGYCAKFCEEQGLTKKQAMTISLGIEEIMELLSKHALAKPEEQMELRLFITQSEVAVRIRCEGKWFNPLCYEGENELDNMGVKLLLKLVKHITYSTNLGMNNIQIVI